MTTTLKELPLPDFYDPNMVVELRGIEYAKLAEEAEEARKRHGLKASAADRIKITLLNIDMQNTFCRPDGELFVAGRSGNGAVDDTRRTVEFIYRNLGYITKIVNTMDTHRSTAIFHPFFLVDEHGNHPAPFTLIKYEDVKAGKWQVTPFAASALEGADLVALQQHLLHYCKTLKDRGRYDLTIWPYHGMIGGVGHALASGLEEASFYHAVARGSQTGFEIKGGNPLTENYSVLGPEVTTTADGSIIAQRDPRFVGKLLSNDMLIIDGQAWSHCVAWSIDDLLEQIRNQDPALAKKVYLMRDCTSAVTVRDKSGLIVVDYTDDAMNAFDRYEGAGMHIVDSTTPIEQWPDVRL